MKKWIFRGFAVLALLGTGLCIKYCKPAPGTDDSENSSLKDPNGEKEDKEVGRPIIATNINPTNLAKFLASQPATTSQESCISDAKNYASQALGSNESSFFNSKDLDFNKILDSTDDIEVEIHTTGSAKEVVSLYIVSNKETLKHQPETDIRTVMVTARLGDEIYQGQITARGSEVKGLLEENISNKPDSPTYKVIDINPLGLFLSGCNANTMSVLRLVTQETSQTNRQRENENSSDSDWTCTRPKTNPALDHVFLNPQNKTIMFRAFYSNICEFPLSEDGLSSMECTDLSGEKVRVPMEPKELMDARVRNSIKLTQPLQIELDEIDSTQTNKIPSNIKNFVNVTTGLFCDGAKKDSRFPNIEIFGSKIDGKLCEARNLNSIDYQVLDTGNKQVFSIGAYEDLRKKANKLRDVCNLTKEKCEEIVETAERINGVLNHKFSTDPDILTVNVIFQDIEFHTPRKLYGIASNIGSKSKRNWVLIDEDTALPTTLIHEVSHIFGGRHGYEISGILNSKSTDSHPAHTIVNDKIYTTLRSSFSIKEHLEAGSGPHKLEVSNDQIVFLPAFSEPGLTCKKGGTDENIPFCDGSKKEGNSSDHCLAAEYYLRGIGAALNVEKAKPNPNYVHDTGTLNIAIDNRFEDPETNKTYKKMLFTDFEDERCNWITKLPPKQVRYVGGMEFASGVQIAKKTRLFNMNELKASDRFFIIGSADKKGETPSVKNIRTAKNRAESFALVNVAGKRQGVAEEVRICGGEELQLPIVGDAEDQEKIRNLQRIAKGRFAATYVYSNE